MEIKKIKKDESVKVKCEKCGTDADLYQAYFDGKPAAVRVLCPKCIAIWR